MSREAEWLVQDQAACFDRAVYEVTLLFFHTVMVGTMSVFFSAVSLEKVPLKW